MPRDQPDGRTDARGGRRDNVTLWGERAEAVRKYLVERGVDASRGSAVGRGEEEPIADNATPEGRANNRRVENILQRAPGTEQRRGGAGSDGVNARSYLHRYARLRAVSRAITVSQQRGVREA